MAVNLRKRETVRHTVVWETTRGELYVTDAVDREDGQGFAERMRGMSFVRSAKYMAVVL